MMNRSVSDDDNEQQQPHPKRPKQEEENGVEETNVPADADDSSSAATAESEDEGASANLLAMLQAAARSQGIPMEWLIQRIQQEGMGESSDDDDEVEYPFEHLPRSLEDVGEFIKSDKCRKILVLAGAGMSVASGIPDFRSPNGLYATLDANQLTASAEERETIRGDPSSALDQHLFIQNPLPCLELQREFLLGTRAHRWKATLAHRFLELLHSKTNKLVRQYTQNIDGLEDQCTQLPPEKVIAVHGSMDRAECALCESEADFGAFCDAVKTQIKDITGQDESAPSESTLIVCEHCGQPSLKPAIVLFHSSLPKLFFEKLPNDIEDIDLLIVIGTSLRVAPANSIVWRVPKSCLRVLVNRESAGEHVGMRFDASSKRDYFAQGEIDQVLLELMDHLGWVDDLKGLLPDQLPESSTTLLKSILERGSTNHDSKSAAAASNTGEDAYTTKTQEAA